MDQRVKGGTPPIDVATLDPSSVPEDSEHDKVPEKKRKGEVESSSVGKKEEKRAAGKKRDGDKGTVLELLIEGRCGSIGQQELPISGRETSCPEGNVRVRIGLEAKRTKKPPKILESYVCKPTIRTYQRQGRGVLLRGDVEGGAGQQSKSTSTTDEASREQRSGLDSVQTISKTTASAALPASSLSSSSAQNLSLLSTFTTGSTPASVPAVPSQVIKTIKQVPVNLADKAEDDSKGSFEKVKKDKHLSVNGQVLPAESKTSSPISSTLSTPCMPTVSAPETKTDGKSFKKQNGLIQTAKQKSLPNGRSSSNVLGSSSSSKNRLRKQSSLSSVSSEDSSTRFPGASSPPDSPSDQPVSPKLQSSTTRDLSPPQFHDQNPESPPEKKREKEKKAKKEKRRDKKSKRDRAEAQRAKSENRNKDVKKKKLEKGKDGKLRHSKDKDEKLRADNPRRDELQAEKNKECSPERHKTDHNNAKHSEIAANGKLDKSCKASNPSKVEEKEKADDCGKLAKQAETALTGDISKEQDITRHQTAPPTHSVFPTPPPLSISSAHPPISPPSSPCEQDSRPLKKRKARRPSWTKLVHRAQRLENQESSSDNLHNSFLSFPQIAKTSLLVKTSIQKSNESMTQSSSLFSSSPPLSSAIKTPTSKQDQLMSNLSLPASRFPLNAIRKRGRPKSHNFTIDEPPPQLSPKAIPNEALPLECDGVHKAPVLEPTPVLLCAAQTKSSPRKRGRPPKRSFFEDRIGNGDHRERGRDFHLLEKGNRQLKLRRLINEMKKRKKRRLHKAFSSGFAGKDENGGGEPDGKNARMCKSIEATTVQTLSALSSSFGSKLGPQINVSKRGTIYMGKRRGRKPKSQAANLNFNSPSSSHLSLFTSSSETSLFTSNQPQHPHSHPFPSPSLTHSSGAQSPYSDGSLTEPTPSLLFSHSFSLPSPSSSCTSPRPPSSSSLSPFVKKSCPCQGRIHFPFHQSSCKLSSVSSPLHNIPGSPGHLKEATPSPRSESHSDETLPSDSGIGTDNNSITERGDMRRGRGMLRLGQGTGMILSGQRLASSFIDRPSPVSSLLSNMPRLTNPLSGSTTGERHRDRHRHRRRDYDCSTSCSCLCPCPCSGHNKCTHTDYYACHNALKKQKNKHKKKHQHLQMQDPEFLAELDDLIAHFNEIHIGRRSWARMGLGQSFDGSVAGRRHHTSSHPLRSNIFRINLNGFYSPNPSSFSASPSFNPQPFYPCPCNKKSDRRPCGYPSKFQETIENMGFYSSYTPVPPSLYHHLPTSYPLPPPHHYASHQPHHTHFFLNPARFHRRRTRLLRDGALGGEGEGEMRRVGGGGGSGFASSLSCGCGRSEHKHKHKHRHRHCEGDVEDEEELHEGEEEPEMLAGSKGHSGFVYRQQEGGRKAARGSGNTLSKESPWLRQNGNAPFSATASTSSSSAAEKYKHTSLSSLGLGSSHLSSFGGGWGGLGQHLTKFGSLGSSAFGNPDPSWKGFTGDQLARGLPISDEEDEDDDYAHESHLYGTSRQKCHTNLFTSAALATGRRGPRSGSRATGIGERLCRREEPAWTERRETGSQGDSKSRGQQKCVPTDNMAVKNKRGPGRPRKHPLPSSPIFSSTTTSVPSSNLFSAFSHNTDGREVGAALERGGDRMQHGTERELQAKRKRGRKKKLDDSLCHQSFQTDKTESDSQSDDDHASFQSLSIRTEESADGPPWKKFLKAGLYSDDYKTTDPPSGTPSNCSESLDYTPGENEYSILPPPIHVGKYLRLKRIHFQLPYDVMWLFQHKQLCREPTIPLKRKRRYRRIKERTASHQRSAEESSSDITSLFPHLDMEPLTGTERSFVVKHHVFLVRNWELVRDRQLRMRMEREKERDEEREEGDEEGDEGDSQSLSCDEASGDDSHIKSDHSVGVEVTVISSDPPYRSQDTSSSLTASPHPTKTPNSQEEEGEEIKRGEGKACSREQRRKRLNDLLLTLQLS